MTTSDRDAYIAGVRGLADALDANPAMPLPSYGSTPTSACVVFLHRLEDALAYAKVMEGVEVRGAKGDYPVRMYGRIKGFHVRVYLHRDACEQRETGSVEYLAPAVLLAVAAGSDALQEKPPADYRSQDGGDAGGGR